MIQHHELFLFFCVLCAIGGGAFLTGLCAAAWHWLGPVCRRIVRHHREAQECNAILRRRK